MLWKAFDTDDLSSWLMFWKGRNRLYSERTLELASAEQAHYGGGIRQGLTEFRLSSLPRGTGLASTEEIPRANTPISSAATVRSVNRMLVLLISQKLSEDDESGE